MLIGFELSGSFVYLSSLQRVLSIRIHNEFCGCPIRIFPLDFSLEGKKNPLCRRFEYFASNSLESCWSNDMMISCCRLYHAILFYSRGLNLVQTWVKLIARALYLIMKLLSRVIWKQTCGYVWITWFMSHETYITSQFHTAKFEYIWYAMCVVQSQ